MNTVTLRRTFIHGRPEDYVESLTLATSNDADYAYIASLLMNEDDSLQPYINTCCMSNTRIQHRDGRPDEYGFTMTVNIDRGDLENPNILSTPDSDGTRLTVTRVWPTNTLDQHAELGKWLVKNKFGLFLHPHAVVLPGFMYLSSEDPEPTNPLPEEQEEEEEEEEEEEGRRSQTNSEIKESLRIAMDRMDDIKGTMPEGHYLRASNALKRTFDQVGN